MRYPHVGDYVTLIISCAEGKKQSGLMFNLKRQLTIEVDILSEQDALFRLSLFNLKQLS